MRCAAAPSSCLLSAPCLDAFISPRTRTRYTRLLFAPYGLFGDPPAALFMPAPRQMARLARCAAQRFDTHARVERLRSVARWRRVTTRARRSPPRDDAALSVAMLIFCRAAMPRPPDVLS